MPIDPRFLPPTDAPAHPVPTQSAADAPSLATPNIGHTLLLGVFVLLASIAVGLAFAFSLKHISPFLHETGEQMQTDPRIVIPVEAVVYGIAAGAAFLLFPLMWRRSFAQGVHWRSLVVQRRWWLLAAIGVGTSVVVQILSNFLPIPKELPIDKFFTNRIGVWLVAVFGVTVAPAFEELAFRGFLLPSLASAWDWVVQRGRWRDPRGPGHSVSDEAWQAEAAVYTTMPAEGESVFQRPDRHRFSDSTDPRWSMPAVIFSTVLTSVGFAMLHGAQLAHSFAPLAVLFTVSLVLCFTRLRFQSLAASTMVHSIYNATIFVILFISTDGFRHLDKMSK